MKTKQINMTVGVKIPVGFGGHVRYEVTEIVDLEPDEDRDEAMKDKRADITNHVWNHAIKMRDRLDADIDEHNEGKRK